MATTATAGSRAPGRPRTGRHRQGRTRSTWAIARIFLLSQMIIVLVVCAAVGGMLYWQTQSAAQDRASDITRAESATLAEDPYVLQHLQAGDATAALQPYTRDILANSSVSFITIMAPDGTRFTHPDESRIGQKYIGDISRAQRGETMTIREAGSLGVSMRTVAPIRDHSGKVVGLVSTGVTINEISAIARQGLPAVALIAGILLLTTTFSTLLLYRYLNRATLGYSHEDILASEATRSMARLLRTQNHEHRNRMHTVLSLLDLGRTRDAQEFAREDLEDAEHQAAYWGDFYQLPAVTALLTGKKTQAAERGIELTARMEGAWTGMPLREIELVSVISNLVDNAMDAVGVAPGPREVEVDMSETETGWEIVVADTGPGIPVGSEGAIFEWGHSTKPAGPEGRGVGLALVRDTLARHGASIEVVNDAGAVFTVRVPRTNRRTDSRVVGKAP